MENPTRQNRPTGDGKADCYSAGERAAMVWYQELREQWLGPLLKGMSRIGIRPGHLSILSLLLGLAFAPLLFRYPALAFVALLLHALVDGVDGPLARHQGTASKAGSFTDTMCDQIVFVTSTVAMMCHPDQFIGLMPGAFYIFLYTIIVGFAMVRNAMGIPYSWLIRPRFIVYIWMALEVFCFPATVLSRSVNVLIWIFNGLFLIKLASGFWKIREGLK